MSHRPSELFARACGAQAPSRNISNFYGLLAWCVGVVVGVTSLYAVRRRSYALSTLLAATRPVRVQTK